MSRILRSSLFAGFFLLFFCASGFAQNVKTAPKISAIRAQLFYDTTGKFSTDILATKDFALWNTIIGEGSAEAPSTSTFVTIEINGTDDSGTAKVGVTATGGKGKVLLKKTFAADLLDRTRFFVPVWLYETGCEEIKLSVRLLVQNVQSGSVVKTIPFACGE